MFHAIIPSRVFTIFVLGHWTILEFPKWPSFFKLKS